MEINEEKKTAITGTCGANVLMRGGCVSDIGMDSKALS
jgi:hypothetical protein